MLRFIRFLSCILLLPFFAQSQPAIAINEFLASNVSINADILDFDDYSDWIELYNATDYDIDINGYFITDDFDNPYKWQFTVSTIIPAKGFLNIWADGYDAGRWRPGRRR